MHTSSAHSSSSSQRGEENLPLVCSHTHYACKALIVRCGCGPEELLASSLDWLQDKGVAPPPASLFEINHTGFHIQCPPSPPPFSLLLQASSPTESPAPALPSPLRGAPLWTQRLCCWEDDRVTLAQVHLVSRRVNESVCRPRGSSALRTPRDIVHV